jgi:hypothetical protein
VTAAPATFALQLYERALAKDPKGRLPFLRGRLYLLRLAFDPEAARPLLDELARREPRNAFVPFERARAAFLVEEQPEAAMEQVRRAAQLPEFSRSYLAAVPAPLRPALKFQRTLRERIQEGWPGYAWLFDHLYQAPRGEPDPAVELPKRLLRLELAARLCRAPDYADQAYGIDRRARELRGLLALGDQLPPDLAKQAQRWQAEQNRLYADYPRSRKSMMLTSQGFQSSEFPTRGGARFEYHGPIA